MSTLYRKYRPQNFNEIVGQNHIKIILQHEIESGQPAHAYLFCGPRAVGKTTLARVLAKSVNCAKRAGGKHEPCDKCANCEAITMGKSLDVMEIDAASHTGVDNVRENIIASARVAPVKLKYKIFIIDEVHMLSVPAFNALLKIIEEPPKYVIFILCTTEIHKVPSTIISRCQRFDFKRIGLNDIVKKLNYIVSKEDIEVEKEILEAIARQAEGHMRDAESLLGQIINIGGKKISREEADLVIPRTDLSEAISLIDMLAKKDSASGIRLINKLMDEGVDLKVFNEDLVEILRKMMIQKISPGLTEKIGRELGETLELKLAGVSSAMGLEQIIAALEEFVRVGNEIKNAYIVQMPFEIAIVRLCSPQSAGQAPHVAGQVPQNGGRMPTSRPPVAGPIRVNGEKKEGLRTDMPKTDVNINFENVLEKWHELLVRIKKYNHSLSFILRVCQPRNLRGDRLCLAFKYKFHRDRVNDPTIKGLVEKALKEVYELPLTVEAIIDENLEIAEQEPSQAGNGAVASEPNPEIVIEEVNEKPAEGGNPMIDRLLKTFGGKIV